MALVSCCGVVRLDALSMEVEITGEIYSSDELDVNSGRLEGLLISEQ
jgi:hypothetical protein